MEDGEGARLRRDDEQRGGGQPLADDEGGEEGTLADEQHDARVGPAVERPPAVSARQTELREGSQTAGVLVDDARHGGGRDACARRAVHHGVHRRVRLQRDVTVAPTARLQAHAQQRRRQFHLPPDASADWLERLADDVRVLDDDEFAQTDVIARHR